MTAGFFSQTAGSGIVSYYIFLVLKQIGITNSNDQLILNGCLTIFNFAIAGGMAFSVDWLGRRPLFLTATFGMCLAMTVSWRRWPIQDTLLTEPFAGLGLDGRQPAILSHRDDSERTSRDRPNLRL